MSEIKHVAIIMDGNGRWAKERLHSRVWGHIRGAKVVRQIVEEADELGVKALTLYAFSTENWSRPVDEIKTLFKLLKKFLLIERPYLIQNNVRFKVIGTLKGLSEETVQLIKDLEDETQGLSGLQLNFAFGYGGRAEIVQAINQLLQNHSHQEITEEQFTQYLSNPLAGDVDLLIRTGGDQRISNFLLWQSAYAELYFTQTKWPDFTRKEFRKILQEVATRQRRFGSVESAPGLETVANQSKNNQILFSSEVQ